MTLNIWNYQGRWEARRRQIADLILHHRPDAVALQEMRHDFRFERGKGQDAQLAELTGYVPTSAVAQVYIPLLRADEGLTILTRDEPKSVMIRHLTLHPHDRADENHRICLGVVLGGRTEYCVFDTHFSLSVLARETNAIEAAEFVQEQAGDRPALLMGDLNAEPDAAAIRFLSGQQEIRGRRTSFLDCWTVAHPGDPGYTYASWDPVRRIDYVLALNVRPDTVRAQVIGGDGEDGIFPSDHMGIVVEVDPL